MDHNNEFKYESTQDSQTILKYLDELKAGLINGKIDFRNEDEKICLHPKGMLNVTIKASKKDNKGKILLKLTWKEKGPKNAEQAPLIIVTQE